MNLRGDLIPQRRQFSLGLLDPGGDLVKLGFGLIAFFKRRRGLCLCILLSSGQVLQARFGIGKPGLCGIHIRQLPAQRLGLGGCAVQLRLKIGDPVLRRGQACLILLILRCHLVAQLRQLLFGGLGAVLCLGQFSRAAGHLLFQIRRLGGQLFEICLCRLGRGGSLRQPVPFRRQVGQVLTQRGKFGFGGGGLFGIGLIFGGAVTFDLGGDGVGLLAQRVQPGLRLDRLRL